MLLDGLLSKIGFSEEDCKDYQKYRQAVDGEVFSLAEKYRIGELHFQEAIEIIKQKEKPEKNLYPSFLIFLLESTDWVYENYQKAGIKEEVFYHSMRDFKYKLDECRRVKGKFGTFVPEWYQRFMELGRFGLGRLQYDVASYDREDITIDGYTVAEGDFILNCHIPSSGPLVPKLCIDSFKDAYGMFQDRLKDGILVIKCCSWLLYPPYQTVFGETSNIYQFAKNFHMVSHRDFDVFAAAWLLFDREYDGDVEKLPADTSLRRKMIAYIKEGGSFGDGTGIILFDGEKVLTRR